MACMFSTAVQVDSRKIFKLKHQVWCSSTLVLLLLVLSSPVLFSAVVAQVSCFLLVKYSCMEYEAPSTWVDKSMDLTYSLCQACRFGTIRKNVRSSVPQRTPTPPLLPTSCCISLGFPGDISSSWLFCLNHSSGCDCVMLAFCLNVNAPSDILFQ